MHLASVVKAGDDTVICQGATVQLFSTGGLTYNWQPAIGLSSSAVASPLATPPDSTSYIVTVTDINDCHIQDSVHVSVWKKPLASAGPDKKIMEGETVQLDGAVAGTNVSYNWSPLYNIGNPQAVQPPVFPDHDTTYVLTVTSQQGCGVSSDAVFVRVLQKIHIPNAFSPNGDGINDTWNIPKLSTYPEADVYVYNRYGQPVFHCKGYNQPWDGTVNGKKLPLGTYYYLVDVKNGQPKLGGWVIILY